MQMNPKMCEPPDEPLVPDWWASYGQQEIAAGCSGAQNAAWTCDLRLIHAANIGDPEDERSYFRFYVVSLDPILQGQQPRCGSTRVACVAIFGFCRDNGDEFNSMRLYLQQNAEDLIRNALP